MAKEKIMVGVDDQVIELTGAELEAFLAQRELDQEQSRLLEAQIAAKTAARESAMNKLSLLGLSEEEINALLG